MKESCERIASVLGINPNADISNFTSMHEQVRSPTNYGSPMKASEIATGNNFY